MRVLHIINGLGMGGAEKSLVRLIASSKDHVNHEVITLLDGGFHHADLHRLGVRVHSLSMRRSILSFPDLVKARGISKQFSPTLIQSWMYHSNIIGYILSRTAHKPLVWNLRSGSINFSEAGLSTTLAVFVGVLISRLSKLHIISCSYNGIKWHKKFGMRGNFHYIPNGIIMHNKDDVTHDELDAERRLLGSKKRFNIACMARYAKQKNHKFLISSFAAFLARHQDLDIKLFLLGDGLTSKNKEILDFIGKLGMTNHIKLFGPLSDPKPILSCCIAHILLSSYGEGFPNSVAETMLLGMPNISSRVGDAAEIIGQTGWVVDLDINSVVRALSALADEYVNKRELWENRVQITRLRISNRYSIDKMIDEYLNVWGRAVG